MKAVKAISSGSLGEAISGLTSFGTFTERTSPTCEVRGRLVYHRIALRLYGVSFRQSVAEALHWRNFPNNFRKNWCVAIKSVILQKIFNIPWLLLKISHVRQ